MVYSPTISSFYTMAERRKPEQTLPTAAENGDLVSNVCAGWFVNRPIDITPYICLPSKLSLVLINKVTITFICLVVTVELYTSLLISSLDNSMNNLLDTCNANDGSNINAMLPTIVGQSILDMAAGSVNAINEQAMVNLNITLVNTQQSYVDSINLLSDSYEQLASSMVLSAYSSASNTTASIHDWLNTTLGNAVAATDKVITNVTSALQVLESAMASSAVLFSQVELGPAANLSLDLIANISVPTGLNSGLTLLYSQTSTGFGFSSLSANATSQIDSLYNKYASQTILTNTLNASSLGSSNFSAIEMCSLGPDISQFYSNLEVSILQIKRNCIVVGIAFAVLALIPGVVYEYFDWKMLLMQAKTLETPGGFVDPVDIINLAALPVTSWVGMQLAKYFSGNEQSRSSARWTNSYALSPSALSMLGLSMVLFLLYIFESSILQNISEYAASDSSFFSSPSSVGGDSSTIVSWTDSVNNALLSAQAKTNDQLAYVWTSSLDDFHGVFDYYQSSLSSKLYQIFNTTAFNMTSQLPASGTIPSQQQILVNLVYANVSYQLLDATTVFNLTAVPSIDSDDQLTAVSSLNSINSQFNYVVITTLRLSMSFFGAWWILAIGAAIFAWVRYRWFARRR